MQAGLLLNCPIKHHMVIADVCHALRCGILNFLGHYLLETSSMLDSSGFLVICTCLSLHPLYTDYTVSNGSFALGGYGYATDGATHL